MATFELSKKRIKEIRNIMVCLLDELVRIVVERSENMSEAENEKVNQIQDRLTFAIDSLYDGEEALKKLTEE